MAPGNCGMTWGVACKLLNKKADPAMQEETEPACEG